MIDQEYINRNKQKAKDKQLAFFQLETDGRHIEGDKRGSVRHTGLITQKEREQLYSALVMLQAGILEVPVYEEACRLADAAKKAI